MIYMYIYQLLLKKKTKKGAFNMQKWPLHSNCPFSFMNHMGTVFFFLVFFIGATFIEMLLLAEFNSKNDTFLFVL